MGAITDRVAAARRDAFPWSTRAQALRWAAAVDFHPERPAPLPDPDGVDPTLFFRWRFCIGWARGEGEEQIAEGLRVRARWEWIRGTGEPPDGACPDADAAIRHWQALLETAVARRWDTPVAVTCAATDSWTDARDRSTAPPVVPQDPVQDDLGWRMTRAATFLPVDVARLWFDHSHQDGWGAGMGYGDDPVVTFCVLTDDEIAAVETRDIGEVLRRTATCWDARWAIKRTWSHFYRDDGPFTPCSPHHALHRALETDE